MRVDLHIHTSERSACARSRAVEQLAAARDCGLDAVAITDHHALLPAAERSRLHALFPEILILPGIEISLDDAYEDILVIGVDHPDLERCTWSWPDLHAFGHEHGGLLILAHPFRFLPKIGIDLDAYPPDAIEGYSANIQPRNHRKIRQVAARLGVPLVANSDAHYVVSIGTYANRLESRATSSAEIIAAIREGRFIVEALDRDS